MGWGDETDVEVANIKSHIKLQKTRVECLANLDLISVEKIGYF